MRKSAIRMVTMLAAAVAVAFTLAAASSTADGKGTASFMTRAQHVGLTNTQIMTLQQEVNTYISRYDGTQVAINKVDFRGGSILLQIPGQDAREIANASAGQTVETVDSSSCPVGDFCEWNNTNYTGSRAEFYTCKNHPAPFDGMSGSWKNDQSPQGPNGPSVIMYFEGYLYVSPPPWSGEAIWSWVDALSVTPC